MHTQRAVMCASTLILSKNVTLPDDIQIGDLPNFNIQISVGVNERRFSEALGKREKHI